MQSGENSQNPVNEYLLKNILTFMKTYFDLNETDFKVISWVPVLYQGWELDDWAVLIETSDKRKILLHTNHGSLIHVVNPRNLLSERIAFYQEAIDKSAAALSVLEGK
jgi:hypothetical protein